MIKTLLAWLACNTYDMAFFVQLQAVAGRGSQRQTDRHAGQAHVAGGPARHYSTAAGSGRQRQPEACMTGTQAMQQVVPLAITEQAGQYAPPRCASIWSISAFRRYPDDCWIRTMPFSSISSPTYASGYKIKLRPRHQKCHCAYVCQTSKSFEASLEGDQCLRFRLVSN